MVALDGPHAGLAASVVVLALSAEVDDAVLDGPVDGAGEELAEEAPHDVRTISRANIATHVFTARRIVGPWRAITGWGSRASK